MDKEYLEQWGSWRVTDPELRDENKKKALEIIEEILKDENFDGPGVRNDNGVNLSICLFMLGCIDPQKWYQDYASENMNGIDSDFDDKLYVINDYLDKWMPINNFDNGYYYLID